MLKYLSLFSGIGGFELGIQQAYEKNMDVSSPTLRQSVMMDSSKRSALSEQELLGTQQPHCVGYSESDPECDKCKREGRGSYQPKTLVSPTRVKCDTCGTEKECGNLAIYAKHFPDHHNYGDVTKIDADSLPDFELLVGGFPCQAFSIAGKRRGFEDTRGTLFFEIARILRAKRPRLFLLENVKGLRSHDEGRTFATIMSTLIELGYDVQSQTLNSKFHGVPQNRERVFFVGCLREFARPEVFPFYGQSNENSTVGLTTETTVARTLTGGGHSGGNHSGMTIIGTLRTYKDGEGFREMKDGICPTIPARAREDGSGQPILNSMGAIRRLTPIECERLQGFPDNWTNSVSDSQRYKCLGNAVTVNVIQDIAERLLFS